MYIKYFLLHLLVKFSNVKLITFRHRAEGAKSPSRQHKRSSLKGDKGKLSYCNDQEKYEKLEDSDCDSEAQ